MAVEEAKQHTVLIVAGEVSGDIHGSHLVRALRELNPSLEFCGVGGDAMQAAGVNLLAHISEMAVVGITEVCSKLGTILGTYRRLKARLQSDPPALVILIDYPDFNLLLARTVHHLKIPLIYYISPQIWAWRRGRIRTIARLVTKMIVIFPFEKALYEQAGVDVTFVGHPLLDSVKSRFSRSEALSYFGLTPGKPTIALLPGSRPSEIQMNFPALLKSVPLVVQQLETVQFIVPVAPGLDIDRILALTKPYDAWVHVIKGHVHDILNISELALVASGTATMETAIIGTPMIIVYRVSPITYLLGRLLIRTKNIGMVNIMAGKTIVPELIQSQCNPDRIAEAVLQLMQDPEKRHTMKQELASLRNSLGKPGASQRAAEVIHTFLKEDRLHARV